MFQYTCSFPIISLLIILNYFFVLTGEGRLQGVGLLHLVILIAVLQGGLGHHQPTGTQDWASLGTIYLLQVSAMLLLRGI